MSMLFCESFDHYSSYTLLPTKWSSYLSASSSSIQTTGGRRNGGHLRLGTGNAEVRLNLQAGIASIVVGCAIRTSLLSNAATGFINLEESGTLHVNLRYQANGSIAIYRGTTLLATTAPALISTGTWYYCELKATISDTVGYYEVRLDGVVVAVASGSPSALDTRNGGTSGVVDCVMITGHTSSDDDFDDLYINSTSGSRNNNFLGDVRVDCYRPNGVGNSSQFANNGGSPSIANYLQVDDTTPDDATTYVESSTVNNIDTYAFPAASHTPAAIHAVQVCAYAAKADAGSRKLNIVTRRSSTNYHSSGYAVQDSYRYIREIRESDPAAASPNDWTAAAISAAEWGVRVQA